MEKQISEIQEGDYKVAITFSTKKNCKLFIFRKGWKANSNTIIESFRCKTEEKAKMVLKKYNLDNIIMAVYIDKDFKQSFFKLNNK